MITSISTVEGLKEFYTERKDNPEYDKELLKGLVLDRADKLEFTDGEIGILESHMAA